MNELSLRALADEVHRAAIGLLRRVKSQLTHHVSSLRRINPLAIGGI
jgi:hypothetical protein